MISFRLNLTGHGWAECVISNGGVGATARASYLSDAIGDFVAALNSLLTSSTDATCEFAEEPGCFRWTFERNDARLRIALHWNDEMSSEWELRFSALCGMDEFARTVCAELDRNLEELGPEGYLQFWGHRFPREAHQRLKDEVNRRPYGVQSSN